MTDDLPERCRSCLEVRKHDARVGAYGFVVIGIVLGFLLGFVART